MDWLESLFPLLLLLIYFLAQIRKRGTKPKSVEAKTPLVEPPGVQRPRKPTPFQEIIRQIQEAAEQAQAQQQGPTPATSEAKTTVPEAIVRSSPTQSPGSSEFHEQGGFQHDQHGFGRANPFSEQVFEDQSPSPPPPAHAPGHIDYNPHVSIGGITEPRIPPRKPHALVRRLRKLDGLKEALVMKEILDRPRGLPQR